MRAQYAFNFYQNLIEQRTNIVSACPLKAEENPQLGRRKIDMWERINKNISEDRTGREKLLFGLKVTHKFVQISETIFCAEKPQT